jgi:cytochrome c-type biogenesis protein CcmH
MNNKRIFAWLLLIIACTAFASPDTHSDAERFTKFTNEVRCIVCQNQNLADSTAPLANDLRQKIYTMILDKKSDQEIKDYLVKRYGEFILLRPQFSAHTFILWLFPFLGLGGILWFLFRYKCHEKNA